jgi:hypothetical protein
MPANRGSARNEDVRICFDRIIPDEYQPARAEGQRSAVQRATATAAGGGRPTAARAGALPELDPLAVGPAVRAAIVVAKKWEDGRIIRCRFLEPVMN